jgi:hypothetical protein
MLNLSISRRLFLRKADADRLSAGAPSIKGSAPAAWNAAFASSRLLATRRCDGTHPIKDGAAKGERPVPMACRGRSCQNDARHIFVGVGVDDAKPDSSAGPAT